MKYEEKTFKNTLIVLLSSILGIIFGYGFRLILARSYPEEQFGLFYAVIAFFGIFSVVQSLGLDSALVKKISEYLAAGDENKIPSIYRLTLMLQTLSVTIFSVILFIYAEPISGLIVHSSAAADVFRMIAVFFFISPLYNILLGILQGYQEMGAYAFWNLMRTISFFVMLVAIMAMTTTRLAMIPAIAYVLGTIIMLVPLYFYVRKKKSSVFAKPKSYDVSAMKDIFVFGFSVSISVVLGSIIGYIDTIMLSFMTSLNQVAIYNVSFPIVQSIIGLVGVLAVILLPLSSEMSIKNAKAQLGAGISRITLYVSILLLPILITIMILPEIFLNALFGPTYISAAPVLQVLCVSAFFFSLAVINNSVLNGLGFPKLVLRAQVIVAIMVVVFNLLLIPFYGVMGVAITTLLSSMTLYFVSSKMLRKHISYTLPAKRIAGVLLSAILFSGVFILLKNIIVLPVFIELFIVGTIATVCYIVMLFLFRTLTDDDLKLFRRLVGSVSKKK